MRVVELFAGTRSVSKAFERKGIETHSIELDTRHPDIDWYADISQITAQDIVDRFGIPDVLWASPPYQSYSVAAIGHHRYKGEDGELKPKTEFAKKSDELLNHLLKIIGDMGCRYNPNMIFFIENPRAGMRTMKCLEHYPRYTITYCQYGFPYQKATDIWTNHPDPQFKTMCKAGDPCHEKAPRGTRNGLQGVKGAVERSRIPDAFCDHIAEICINETKGIKPMPKYHQSKLDVI